MSPNDIPAYMAHVGVAARAASTVMAASSTAQRNAALRGLAARLREHTAALQQANALDLQAARVAGLAAPLLDRLKLTPQILDTVAEGCEQIAAMADPVGEISELKRQPSGISVGRMRVPLGVFGMIYESRPNVTIEARRWPSRAPTPASCAAAPRRCSRTWRCGSKCRPLCLTPGCRPMRCNWCRPPIARPSAG